MVDATGALGEVVTGSLAARAAEPVAGEGQGHAAACLNCGTGLLGAHCHRCGQAGHVHRTLGAFWHDIAHSVLHFDGKIWRTLPLLAWRPGELTRRYIAGERARFVSPMALFLFSVFLMFAVFSSIGGPIAVNPMGRSDAEAAATQQERRGLIERVRVLERDRVEAVRGRQPTAKIDRRLNDARAELGAINLASGEDVGAGGGRLVVLDGVGGGTWLERTFEKANKNPSLLLYKLQSNAYKYSWALIPISVPLVWLLFAWRRRYRLYDHTVFVTYSIAFMSLVAIALSVLRALGGPASVAEVAVMLVPPLHMYRQLRGAYSLSRVAALWRTGFLLMFAGISAILFVGLLLMLGLLG